ncbi:MAG TPA: LPS assembly lipoprotein LptE [Candidatus Tectomicrobia bacterium]|nr:LPS assembly lipoprotein LptE [Candidatus Tectomicrobia bacterium]
MLRAQRRCRILLVLLLALTAGCGYQLSGQAGTIPGHLQRISVPIFSNATTVPGLEQLVTAAVRTQLQRDGRVRLGTEASSTAVLHGEVRRYEAMLLATNRDDFALEYRVEVEVRIVVADLQQRQTVLDQTLTVNSEYVVSSQIVPTDIARDRALLVVARDAGERVVSLLLDRF